MDPKTVKQQVEKLVIQLWVPVKLTIKCLLPPCLFLQAKTLDLKGLINVRSCKCLRWLENLLFVKKLFCRFLRIDTKVGEDD